MGKDFRDARVSGTQVLTDLSVGVAKVCCPSINGRTVKRVGVAEVAALDHPPGVEIGDLIQRGVKLQGPEVLSGSFSVHRFQQRLYQGMPVRQVGSQVYAGRLLRGLRPGQWEGRGGQGEIAFAARPQASGQESSCQEREEEFWTLGQL